MRFILAAMNHFFKLGQRKKTGEKWRNLETDASAISLACGMAKGRDVKGEPHNVIALVGDGALSGGEAFEGLNNASALGSDLILMVNDNDMSIAENHGGLYQNLRLLRETEGKTPYNIFLVLGFDHVFVHDGNILMRLWIHWKKLKIRIVLL